MHDGTASCCWCQAEAGGEGGASSGSLAIARDRAERAEEEAVRLRRELERTREEHLDEMRSMAKRHEALIASLQAEHSTALDSLRVRLEQRARDAESRADTAGRSSSIGLSVSERYSGGLRYRPSNSDCSSSFPTQSRIQELEDQLNSQKETQNSQIAMAEAQARAEEQRKVGALF